MYLAKLSGAQYEIIWHVYMLNIRASQTVQLIKEQFHLSNCINIYLFLQYLMNIADHLSRPCRQDLVPSFNQLLEIDG